MDLLLYSVNEGSSWTEITSLRIFNRVNVFISKYDAIVVGYKGKDGIYVYMNSQVYNYATGHDCTYISKISDDNILISSDTSGLFIVLIFQIYNLKTISVNGFNNAIGSGNCLLTKSEYGISISLNFGNTWNDFTFEERIMNVAISENLSEIIISTEKGNVLKSTTRGESFNKIADIVPNPRLELSPILIGINSSGQYITLFLCPHEIVSSLNFVDFVLTIQIFFQIVKYFFNSFMIAFWRENSYTSCQR